MLRSVGIYVWDWLNMVVMNVVVWSSMYYKVNMCLLVCKSKPNEAFDPVMNHVCFIHCLVLSSLPYFLA